MRANLDRTVMQLSSIAALAKSSQTTSQQSAGSTDSMVDYMATTLWERMKTCHRSPAAGQGRRFSGTVSRAVDVSCRSRIRLDLIFVSGPASSASSRFSVKLHNSLFEECGNRMVSDYISLQGWVALVEVLRDPPHGQLQVADRLLGDDTFSWGLVCICDTASVENAGGDGAKLPQEILRFQSNAMVDLRDVRVGWSSWAWYWFH